jgi:hypothetical protein
VKISGTCKRDGRPFLVEQVIGGGGACPWDGEPFSSDYAAVLVESLRAAEVAGTELERALAAIADLAPAFELDEDSVLGELREHLARLGGRVVERA